jgi:hypothetical protein
MNGKKDITQFRFIIRIRKQPVLFSVASDELEICRVINIENWVKEKWVWILARLL